MTEQRAVLPQTKPDFGPRFQARGARVSARQQEGKFRDLQSILGLRIPATMLIAL
jgi:hypothetical protein